jgi:hypothetical protein
MNIDEMIDIMSDDMPEFITASDPSDRELFEYIHYLIIMSKMLTVPRIIGIVGIDKFSDQFLSKINEMFKEFDGHAKLKKSYDYVVEFYANMVDYLERIEEYEMCSNFTKFFKTFNKKVNELNGLED